MAIDLNEYYKNLVGSGTDPIEAAQIVSYQLIDNPSGSLTKIKLPPKWYTYDDYLSYSAPDYVQAISYQGDDPLAVASRDLLANPNTTLTDISVFSRSNRDKLAGLDPGDYYNQLKDLYDQRESAKKGYEKQLETHEFSQYGLPDPTLRYGVKERVENGKTYVLYQPAVDYLNKKTTDYYNKLRNNGLEANTAAERTAMYNQKLSAAVENKITQAGYSPFVEAVAKLRKIKK